MTIFLVLLQVYTYYLHSYKYNLHMQKGWAKSSIYIINWPYPDKLDLHKKGDFCNAAMNIFWFLIA